MTIFDSIKYPISDPPTLDEIQSLPYEIKREFISYTYTHANDPDFNAMNILKRIIVEYDGDDI